MAKTQVSRSASSTKAILKATVPPQGKSKDARYRMYRTEPIDGRTSKGT